MRPSGGTPQIGSGARRVGSQKCRVFFTLSPTFSLCLSVVPTPYTEGFNFLGSGPPLRGPLHPSGAQPLPPPIVIVMIMIISIFVILKGMMIKMALTIITVRHTPSLSLPSLVHEKPHLTCLLLGRTHVRNR